jgi:hypothetical protein
VAGLGDPATDVLATFRRSDQFLLSGGYRRDLYTYLAKGDPFPYDTVRERSFVNGRLTLAPSLVLRLDWERNTREGDAITSALTGAREIPPGEEVDEIVRDQRPLSRTFDKWELGIDWGAGPLRFGLTQTIRTGSIDDRRTYEIPSDDTRVREALRRDVDSDSYTTLFKVGAALFDRTLDMTLFLGFTRLELDTDVTGAIEGFDNVFSEGSPKGPFSSEIEGRNRHERSEERARLEAAWRPHPDFEAILGAGIEDLTDEVSLDTVETRTFEDPTLPTETRTTKEQARITFRTDRLSLDALWDISADLRIRLGTEYYGEEFEDPTSSRGDSRDGTHLRARTWRHTAGIDVTPMEGLSLSVLGRHLTNSEPHSSVSAERAEELSFRGRYTVSPDLFLSAVYRRNEYHHSDEFESDTSSDSLSGTVSATTGPVLTRATVTWQTFDTRTGTSFFDFGRAPAGRVEEDVEFRSRDLIVDIDVSWSLTSLARISAGGILTRTGGDYEAITHAVHLIVEYDLTAAWTGGLALRSWRLDEARRDVDDYTTNALEATVTYRF